MSKKNQYPAHHDQNQEPSEQVAPTKFEEEPVSPGISREIKIGLVVVAVLLGLVSYVIYGRLSKPQTQTAAQAPKGTAPSGSPAAPTPAESPNSSDQAWSGPAMTAPTFVSATAAPPANPFGSPSSVPSAWTMPSGSPSAASNTSGDRYASSPPSYMPKAFPSPPSDRYAGYAQSASTGQENLLGDRYRTPTSAAPASSGLTTLSPELGTGTLLPAQRPDPTRNIREPVPFAGPPLTTPTSTASRLGARPYVVREGDSLFDIARYELGKASRWSEIYELNRDLLGSQIDYLSPGTTLLLPGDQFTSGTLAERPSASTYRR